MYQDKETPTAPGASAPLRSGGCAPRSGGRGGRASAPLLPVLAPLRGGSSLRAALF